MNYTIHNKQTCNSLELPEPTILRYINKTGHGRVI